jgi:hypothetical protein
MDHFEIKFGLMRAQKSHPEVNFRHIIGPSRDMPNKICPIEFTKEEVRRLIALGEKDAINYFSTHKSHPKVGVTKKYMR